MFVDRMGRRRAVATLLFLSSVGGASVLPLAWPSAAIAAPEAGAPVAESAAQDRAAQVMALPWVTGPAQVEITPRATLNLPAGARYLDNKGTEKLLRLTGNLPDDHHYTVAREDLGWFAVFSFDDIGYVKDDETIDPAALLKSMKEGEAEENQARKAAGADALFVEGWVVEPHYDRATRNLEWGTKLRDEAGNFNVNYTVRLLGRHGVISGILVSSQETLQSDLGEFRKTLSSFAYKPGERYEQFAEGDRVAEYGLAALVAGGAAAAAVKSGVWKVVLPFLKYIAVLFIGIFAVARRWIAGLFTRKAE